MFAFVELFFWCVSAFVLHGWYVIPCFDAVEWGLFVQAFFCKLNKIFVLKKKDGIVSESIIGKCKANIDLLGLEVWKIK